MIREACKLLHQQGVDLSPYDTDGDGVVDNVYVIYAGYGQADSNKPNTIWPHSWNLSNIGADIQLGNVKIDRYATSQEINGQSNKPVGIGTFVHEFGPRPRSRRPLQYDECCCVQHAGSMGRDVCWLLQWRPELPRHLHRL